MCRCACRRSVLSVEDSGCPVQWAVVETVQGVLCAVGRVLWVVGCGLWLWLVGCGCGLKVVDASPACLGYGDKEMMQGNGRSRCSLHTRSKHVLVQCPQPRPAG